VPIPETRASPSSAGHLIGRIPLGSACGASRRSRGAFSARCARSPRRLRRRRFLPEYEKNAKFPREPQGNYNSQLLCPHVLVPRSLLGQRGFCLSKDGEHKTLLDAAFANSASHLCGSYGFASHYGRWYMHNLVRRWSLQETVTVVKEQGRAAQSAWYMSSSRCRSGRRRQASSKRMRMVDCSEELGCSVVSSARRDKNDNQASKMA